MDQNEYNQISAYHLNKAIPNTCIDNLSRNAVVPKLKRYHFSDGVLQKFRRTVVSASAAWETLKHIHDVILDHTGAGKALESFAAERHLQVAGYMPLSYFVLYCMRLSTSCYYRG